MHAHADGLHYGRAVQHLHDRAGGADALQDWVRDEDLVEAVDEGEEVGLGDVVGLEGGWVGAGEGAGVGAAEGFGYFWRVLTGDVLVSWLETAYVGRRMEGMMCLGVVLLWILWRLYLTRMESRLLRRVLRKTEADLVCCIEKQPSRLGM